MSNVDNKEAINEVEDIVKRFEEFTVEEQCFMYKLIGDKLLKKAEDQREELANKVKENEHYISSIKKLKTD